MKRRSHSIYVFSVLLWALSVCKNKHRVDARKSVHFDGDKCNLTNPNKKFKVRIDVAKLINPKRVSKSSHIVLNPWHGAYNKRFALKACHFISILAAITFKIPPFRNLVLGANL